MNTNTNTPPVRKTSIPTHPVFSNLQVYHTDIEEAEGLAATSTIISSLFTQIDTIEKAERKSAEAFRLQQEQQQQHLDTLEKERRESAETFRLQLDTLRKSARDIEKILHQQHVARQKARIKRLHKTATESAGGIPTTTKQLEPKKSIVTAASAAASTPAATIVATPLAAKVATTSANKAGTSASISTTKAATASASKPSTAATAPQALSDMQQDTTMAMDEDDDADYYSLPPPPPAQAAPVAPMTVEAPKATSKPVITPSKQTMQTGRTTWGFASETSAAATSKPPRPVQKMVPSRGRPTRGRGVSRGRIAISSSSSSSSSNGSPEPEEVPSIPRRGGLGRTGRRSRPFRGGGTTRISVSSVDEDEETQFTPIIPSSRRNGSGSGFTAVNTPRTWNDETENRAISSFPAGAGPASSTKKPIPPAKTTVDQVALFTPKDLRGIYGGGNPGLICATVKSDDIARAVIRTHNYICLSPDAHFKPPGTIGDNAEMLDIYGQDDPIDKRVTTVPVLRKVDRLWMYCGNYKVGERRMVALAEWHEGSGNVKKHWAKKMQDTEWGREWLVRKGWLVHGEIRNVSLDEILGYFAIVGYPPPDMRSR